MDQALPKPDIVEQIGAKISAGELVEAERLCRAALADQPDNAALIFKLGQIAAESRRFPDAVNCYRWAEGVGLNSPELYRAIGEACQEMRWHERAEEAFRHYLEFDPYNFDVWIRLGVALTSQKKHVEAVLLLRETAARVPTATNQFNWGQALVAAGRIEEAVTPFKIGAALDDAPAPLFFELANALTALGRTEEAAELLKRGLELEPQNASATAALAELTANS